MSIDLFGLLSFIVALWLINTLGVRSIPAAMIAGGAPLLIKAIERYAATHFYPEHTVHGWVVSANDVVTAVTQFLVALIVFWMMRRFDDSITNYIIAALVGGVVGSMIAPYFINMVLS